MTKNLSDVEKYKVRLLSKRRIEGDCWIWIGAKDKDGYGLTEVEGSTIRVHRLAMMIFQPGKLDSLLNVNHVCNNRACFNPNHLYVGTQQDNRQDYAIKISSCPKGHPYTKENTILKRGYQRSCRVCHNEQERVRRELKKNAKSV